MHGPLHPARCCMTRKKVIWIIIAVAVAVAVGVPVFLHIHRLHVISERLQVPIEGAVIQRDADTKKELPISDVEITATDGVRSTTTVSDSSGYFKLVFHKRVLSDEPIIVTFRHARYEPLELSVPTRRLETPSELYVEAMVPVPTKPVGPKGPNRPAPKESVVSNIRVRYTINN